MGCLKYGYVSKNKRRVAYGLMVTSLIVPDLGAGFIIGCTLLGLNIKIIAKDKIRSFKDSLKLKLRCWLW